MEAFVELVAGVAKLCPTGRLPNSYLVFDLETSGFNHSPRGGQKPDVVVQVGIAAVNNGELVDRQAVYIKRPPGTMHGSALEVTGITDEILAEQGVEPEGVYPTVVRLLQLYRDSGAMFVGHNMIGFDIPFLEADLRRHGFDFEFQRNEYIDTGMMFKAAQTRHSPGVGEDLTAFFSRIRDIHSRSKWNLRLAVETFGVDIKHGLNMDEAHDAGFDCLATHLLLCTLREQAGV